MPIQNSFVCRANLQTSYPSQDVGLGETFSLLYDVTNFRRSRRGHTYKLNKELVDFDTATNQMNKVF